MLTIPRNAHPSCSGMETNYIQRSPRRQRAQPHQPSNRPFRQSLQQDDLSLVVAAFGAFQRGVGQRFRSVSGSCCSSEAGNLPMSSVFLTFASSPQGAPACGFLPRRRNGVRGRQAAQRDGAPARAHRSSSPQYRRATVRFLHAPDGRRDAVPSFRVETCPSSSRAMASAACLISKMRLGARAA